MVGEPIEQVQRGIRDIIQNLRVDPYALETAFISIIAFAGKARQLTPLTELYKFYPPELPIGGGTSLGAGLECLMDDMDRNVQKTTAAVKGDWKPIIFLFTDGNPTDRYQAAFRRWNDNYRSHCSLVVVSLGDNANTLTLAQLTENVLLLKDTDAESYAKFFKWVTASIQATSQSATTQSDDEVKLAPTSGINLEKADTTRNIIVDENFAILHGRCQNTGKDYLVKYARRNPSPEFEALNELHPQGFKLVGTYPIDKDEYASLSTGETRNINTTQLFGRPTCPCCGNQLGVVVCECGNIFCVGDSLTNTCPWCGLEGTLGAIGEGGANVAQGQG